MQQIHRLEQEYQAAMQKNADYHSKTGKTRSKGFFGSLKAIFSLPIKKQLEQAQRDQGTMQTRYIAESKKIIKDEAYEAAIKEKVDEIQAKKLIKSEEMATIIKGLITERGMDEGELTKEEVVELRKNALTQKKDEKKAAKEEENATKTEREEAYEAARKQKKRQSELYK